MTRSVTGRISFVCVEAYRFCADEKMDSTVTARLFSVPWISHHKRDDYG